MAENTTGSSHHDDTRYIIIHGHFYQPPRENPWIDIVERQPSAAPAHDWNERVYDECYRPNAYSRLLDEHGMITGIHNNYCKMSYNFGPTLFRWLEDQHPVVVQRIIDADVESRQRLNGHGNAIAQVFNHIILPLSSRRDQLTQIRWAKTFFRSRFGREPEGMWLSETALNMDTVYCLIEEGIRFVILAPTQADRYRRIDTDGQWINADERGVDTRRAYRVYPYTKSGKRLKGHLDVFFFDQGLSRGVSFEGLLNQAHFLGQRLRSSFDDNLPETQASIIATDGETFGHHKAFGDMCLAYLFTHTASEMGLVPVNFAWFLDQAPPVWEVRLKNAFGEGSAWSCAHGTGRWIRDCGCSTGGPPEWNQKWREPFRDALEVVQKKVDRAYENTLKPVIKNPWAFRDAFGAHIGTVSQQTVSQLLLEHGAKEPIPLETIARVTSQLQAQKYMLYAFTSCAWFFTDITGIETVQNMRYAARAMQLALDGHEFAATLEAFLSILETAKSNLPEKNGKTVFLQEVMPDMKHLHVLAFDAVADYYLKQDQVPIKKLYGYSMQIEHLDGHSSNIRNTDAYSVHISNEQTAERDSVVVLLHHQDGTRMSASTASVNDFSGKKFDLWEMEQLVADEKAHTMSVSDLFFESRGRLTALYLARISKDTLVNYEAWMQGHEAILDTLTELRHELPEYVHGPIAFILNNQWNRTLEQLAQNGQEDTAFTQLLSLWKKVRKYGITLDYSFSVTVLEQLLKSEIERFTETLNSVECDRMRYLLNVVDRFSIPVHKNRLEDRFYTVLTSSIQKTYNEIMENSESEDMARSVLVQILSFARRMNFNTEQFPLPQSVEPGER